MSSSSERESISVCRINILPPSEVRILYWKSAQRSTQRSWPLSLFRLSRVQSWSTALIELRKRCAPSNLISAATSKQKCELGPSNQWGWGLASLGALAFQSHTGRSRLGNQAPAFIRNFTLNVANRAAPSHHFALSS